MAGELRGTVAIVTGASMGIGQSAAEALAAAGADVALFARSEDRLQQVADQARRRQVKILTHAGDVTDRDAVAMLVKRTREELGTPDILVNNAGTNTVQRGVSDISAEDWDRVVSVNLTGAYNLVREVLPLMKENGGGVIVNVVSLAGKTATKLAGVAYSASKFGMAALTESINDEERGHGIRATSIFPGEVETPILAKRPDPPSPEQVALFLQPEDVAAAIVFACSLPPRACVPELVIRPTRTIPYS